MGSRRPHIKTRNACGQCKRRRVRCNLQGPICSNCQRRRETCDYSLEYGAAAPAVTRGSGASFRSSFEASIPSHPSRVPQVELVNIVRWFDTTCEPPRTMIPGAPLASFEFKPQYSANPQIFQYLVPYIAAVRSLYSIHQDRSREPGLLPPAYEASVAASTAFRGIEKDVNGNNWPSILLFILCNLMFYFGASRSTALHDFDYLEIFQCVLRGTGAIRKELLMQVFMTGLVRENRAHYSHMASPCNMETQGALTLLASASHPDGTPDATIVACNEALVLLKRWVVTVDGYPKNWAHFFYWPCAVSEAFVLALGGRQPIATLIFVHWCAVMHHAPKTWFLDGWARRTALAAMAAIPPTIDYGLLRWPIAVFNPSPGLRVYIAFEETGKVSKCSATPC
ncbi:hypothetical protein GGR58DRAFT_454602 [Xylaria digitata]|nr:hypothetical protein GGR58DRAFT_454602 [Xylaria digitata]